MRYFVKSHYSGWNEVTKDQYLRFVDNIRTGATAMTEKQKLQLIERVTKVEPKGGSNAAHNKEK